MQDDFGKRAERQVRSCLSEKAKTRKQGRGVWVTVWPTRDQETHFFIRFFILPFVYFNSPHHPSSPPDLVFQSPQTVQLNAQQVAFSLLESRSQDNKIPILGQCLKEDHGEIALTPNPWQLSGPSRKAPSQPCQQEAKWLLTHRQQPEKPAAIQPGRGSCKRHGHLWEARGQNEHPWPHHLAFSRLQMAPARMLRPGTSWWSWRQPIHGELSVVPTGPSPALLGLLPVRFRTEP